MWKKNKLDPFVHVEHHLLKDGRGSISDGLNWLRCLVGCLLIAFVVFLIAVGAPIDNGSVLMIVSVVLIGSVATAAWIIKSEETATAKRLNELKQTPKNSL